ncbi:tyrosine-protein phosphatase [Clostridium beijerinckii]|uniref:protein-tyrosine-phosphatase n=1 Tax=Clostridium beijerinckii TaxID=1520 RepID=A0AAE5LS14_CLOBE|nr:CpsB/CapC family capsule biosynthesis tyrosine phosphatase [Clostridium beijerinckii]NSB16563.1 protein-tyrosine phosphatase [Clostridium beijerinckii]OOM23607.1 tyrosine-protein phosphatase YwqE [Clostridium beijerinckii]
MIVDIHSHIIPGIDDGSKDMEMTLEMLRNAEKDGVKEIVATPHYLLEYGEATIDEVKNYVKEINNILGKENIDIKIYSGQEVYYTEKIIEYYMQGNIGTLNDSRYMLVEFPMRKFDESIFDTLYELQVRNIVPVIAHPERYIPIIEDPKNINKFINEGYLFQVNAGSIDGRFGEKIQKTANILLDNGIYNFIGSDAHNINRRNTGLSTALDLINKSTIKNIFKESSEKILNNGEVKFLGEKIKEKKSIFWFLKR